MVVLTMIVLFNICAECECNPEGSRDLQCDLGQGQCLCWPNVEGRTCDRCVENKYNISAGCVGGLTFSEK